MTQLFDSTIDVRSTPPNYREGAQYVDPDTGALWIGFDNGGGGDWHPVPPIRVTQEAATFSESGLTVTHTNTEVSANSIQLPPGNPTIDDFESGDLVVENEDWTDWDGDTGSVTVQTGTVISGTYTAEFTASNSANRFRSYNNDRALDMVGAKLRIDTDTGNSTDSCIFRIYTEGGNKLAQVKFYDGTQNIEVNGTDTGSNWTTGTTYTVEFRNIDYSAETLDVYLNGNALVTGVSFVNSASAIGRLVFFNNTLNSGATRNLYLDDVEEKVDIKSGDAILEWSDAEDLNTWDLVTFQRTLDGETVTVDVEDEAGNVIQSDISHNFDISNVANSKQPRLHVYFTRNDLTNNPSLDYAARRYLR